MMGIIPRAVSNIFRKIHEREDLEEYRFKCSFMEIYQEKPRDLIQPNTNEELGIHLNKSGETVMKGLSETDVESLGDVLKLIQKATYNRTKAATKMNLTSSRSHMLMKLTVIMKV